MSCRSLSPFTGQGVPALITLFLCAVLDTFFEKCCCNGTCEQEAAVGLKGTKATPGFMWKAPIYSNVLVLMQYLEQVLLLCHYVSYYASYVIMFLIIPPEE